MAVAPEALPLHFAQDPLRVQSALISRSVSLEKPSLNAANTRRLDQSDHPISAHASAGCTPGVETARRSGATSAKSCGWFRQQGR